MAKRNKPMGIGRWIKNAFWYLIVMLVGIGWGKLFTSDDAGKVTWWVGGLIVLALLTWWIVARLRERFRL